MDRAQLSTADIAGLIMMVIGFGGMTLDWHNDSLVFYALVGGVGLGILWRNIIDQQDH